MTNRQNLPVLPLRGTVIFPGLAAPIAAGRPGTLRAIEAALKGEPKAIQAIARAEPKPDDLFEMGCVSSILQMLKLPDGTVKVLVEGVQRANTQAIHEDNEYFTADVVPVRPDFGSKSSTGSITAPAPVVGSATR